MSFFKLFARSCLLNYTYVAPRSSGNKVSLLNIDPYMNQALNVFQASSVSVAVLNTWGLLPENNRNQENKQKTRARKSDRNVIFQTFRKIMFA